MARVRGNPTKEYWPSWRYGPEGQKGIFDCAEDVPAGWGRKPGELGPVIPQAPVEVLDRDALIFELHSLAIDINPQWGVAHMKKVIDDQRSTR